VTEILASWVAFPALVVAVTIGGGLLVERAAGGRLPRALLAPVGLALVIVTADLLTRLDATAELATPACIVLALAGYALGRQRLRALRLDPWAAVAAVGVFALYALPIVASGDATFAGYTLLGDTSVQFVLLDHVFQHGHDVTALVPSSTASAVQTYLDSEYPLGASLPLGALRPLTGTDLPWLYQPYLALLMAYTSLAAWSLLEPLARSRALRALCVFCVPLAGLVYAFGLQGSVKELGTAWILFTAVALAAAAIRDGAGWRRSLPVVLGVAAGFSILSVAVVPWLGPVALAFAVAFVLKRPAAARRGAVLQLGALALGAAILALPVLLSSDAFVRVATGVLTEPGDLGNLAAPLEPWQLFGVWPSGDFRFPIAGGTKPLAGALIALVALSAAAGVVWAARRRLMWPLVAIGAALVALAYLAARGSPYADAKALAIASAAVVFAALLAPLALAESGRTVLAWTLAGALAFGVVWTDARAYFDSYLAPRERFEELASIGERERGPLLLDEYEEFAKYFLRDAEPGSRPEIPPQFRRGRTPTAGSELPTNLDALDLRYVERFPALVLRRSPVSSRPPANFELSRAGRYYAVWRRTERPSVLAHFPFGAGLQPAARPRCSRIREIAAQARGARAGLAYVERPRLAIFHPRPPGAARANDDPLAFATGRGVRTITGTVELPRTGRYEAWLEGSLGRPVAVRVGGRAFGTAPAGLGNPGQLASVGDASVSGGLQPVELAQEGRSLRPGSDGRDRTIGPLVLEPASAGRSARVRYLDPRSARSLCGRTLDWIEIVRGGGA